MDCPGKIVNGVVVLDEPGGFREGQRVTVRPARRPARGTKKASKRPLTVAERLAPFIGKLEGLPPDLSVNLDHYLYGVHRPKMPRARVSR